MALKALAELIIDLIHLCRELEEPVAKARRSRSLYLFDP